MRWDDWMTVRPIETYIFAFRVLNLCQHNEIYSTNSIEHLFQGPEW